MQQNRTKDNKREISLDILDRFDRALPYDLIVPGSAPPWVKGQNGQLTMEN